MTIRKKATAAIVGALSLSFFLTACGGGGGGSDTSTTSDAPGKQNTTGAMTDFKAGEQFTATDALKFSLLFSDAATYPYKSDWLLWSEITKRTNVTLDTTVVPASDYSQKRSLLIGAGNAPYIIAKTYPGQETSFVASGSVLPVSDYLDLMPNLSEKIKEWNLADNLNQLRQADGKFYVLPGVHEAPWQDYTIAMRTDILKKLNIATPTTWDEFRTALEKIKAADPSDTPFYDRFSGTYPGGSILNVASLGFGTVAGWGYNNAIWDATQNKFVATAEQPQYKALVDYFRGLVADGLMDPEGFTQKTDDTAISKFVTGKSAAISTNAQTLVNDLGALTKNIPTGTVDKIPVPCGDAGCILSPVSKLENGLMISSKATESPNFVAMMQFIDWLWYSDEGQEFAKWGVLGTTFTKDASGTRTLDPGISYVQMNAGAPKHLQKDFGFSGGNFAYGGTTDLLQSTFSDQEVGFQKSIADYKLSVLAPPAPLNETELESNSLIDTALKDAVSQGTLQFILGQRPMSDWDTFVKELDAKGAQKYVDVVNTAQQRYAQEHS